MADDESAAPFQPGSLSKSEDIISAFRLYDATGTGIISKEDFRTLMKRLMPNGLSGHTDILIDRAGANIDGGVDYTKYTDWLFQYRESKRDMPEKRRRKTNLLADIARSRLCAKNWMARSLKSRQRSDSAGQVSISSTGFVGQFQYCTVNLVGDPNQSSEVELSMPLNEVQELLKEELGVHPERQRLIFGSEEIAVPLEENDKTLATLGVKENALLFLVEEIGSSASTAPAINKRKVLVTCHMTEENGDAHTFSMELSQGSSVQYLKREVGKRLGIPTCCVFLKRDNPTGHSAQDDEVRDGDMFEVRDHALKSLGPYALSRTIFTDEDFILPSSRQCLLSYETTALAIKREAFTGTLGILSLCIPRWPLVAVLGPLSPLTLSEGEREWASIPEEAAYYAWMYPVSVDLRTLPSSLKNMSSRELDLIMSGGFIYFDEDIRIIAVNSMRVSKHGGLVFSDPLAMPAHISKELFLQGRVHRVTAKSFSQLGIRSFAWVHPGESFKVPDEEDCDDEILAEHGGFAFFYHHSHLPSEEEASGDRFFAVQGVDPKENLGHLMSLALEMQGDRKAILPFEIGASVCVSPPQCISPSPGDDDNRDRRGVNDDTTLPETLVNGMAGKETDWKAVNNAAQNIRNANYNLGQFHEDMVSGFPELELYRLDGEGTQVSSSGRTAQDEYLRTIGALFAVYWLMRLDMGGQEAFCYGVDEETAQIRDPPDVKMKEGLQWPVMSQDQRRINFHRTMCWDKSLELFVQAGLLISDGSGGWYHDIAATKSLLVLTALHDIMKNEKLLPVVDSEHAPYEGHDEGVLIRDHDIALAYVLEHYPDLLPSYAGLDEDSRKTILFTQGRMGFNNGWLVQAEAPPGPLFSNICEMIQKGAASQKDLAFYFVHWVTDLAGAIPKPFEGGLKFTVQFPVFVLRAFFDSFPFLWRLAAASPADVYLNYLEWRWSNLALPMPMAELDESAVALSRLCVAVQSQDKAKKVIEAWDALSEEDRTLLSLEMGLTGIEDGPYAWGAPTEKMGPCFLCYYSPAFLLKHVGCGDRPSAIKVLVEVYRAGRILFPNEEDKAGEFRTLQVAQLKELMSEDIPKTASMGEAWVLARRSDKEAVVEKHPLSSLVIGGTNSLDVPFVLLPLWSGPEKGGPTEKEAVDS